MTEGTDPAGTAHRIEIEEPAPGVRVIAFNRPDVRNAFDTAMYQEVTAALRAADRDDAVGAVVLTGRGSAFTSGQDLAEMAAIATGTAVEGAGQGFIGLLDCLTESSVPLLAAVNGVAVGLGFTLLAHCDLVLVAADARLRVPFAELGVPARRAHEGGDGAGCVARMCRDPGRQLDGVVEDHTGIARPQRQSQ